MWHYFSSQTRPGASHLSRYGKLACAASALAMFAALSIGPALAQPKGTGKAAKSDAAKSDKAKSDAKGVTKSPEAMLIGDAVDNPESQQYAPVAKAIERFSKRDFEGARKLLVEARTNHPKLAPVEVMMAKLWAAGGVAQAARGELEQAVRRHPDDPDPYLLFAELSLNERRVTDAEALLEKAEKLVQAFNDSPKRKENFQKRLLNGMAMIAESRQQWEEAEKLRQQLIKLDGDNAVHYLRLGQVLFQQATDKNQKYSDSYEAFRAALKIDPNVVKPDVAMGSLFEQAAQTALNANDKEKFKKHRDEAIRFFKRATEPGRTDLASLLSAAQWAIQTNQLNLAENYAESAIKLDPNSVDARVIRALVARFSEDYKTAEAMLLEAFNKAPGSFTVSDQLALVLVESDDKESKNRALQLAEVNFRQYQQNPQAAATLAWVYYRLGRAGEAGRLLNAVMQSQQVSADSAYYVARVLADQGRSVEATQLLEAALANPQPFANRLNASDLLNELRTKAAAAEDDSKEGKESAKESKSKSSK